MEATENKRGVWGTVFSIVFILIVMGLLAFYWFVPVNNFEFGKIDNSNFTLNSNSSMQFYPNMRFPESKIFYRIYDCPLKKQNDMERAFEIISNKTILEFHSISSGEEIFVTCDSKNKFEGNLFVAGEGGPTNITQTKNFNVILNGQILLIRDSVCENPNIAIHELLHVLGFEHSENPNNIMYNFSDCRQTIGEDTINLINELYLTPNYADLSFENVSALMNGRYLNADIAIRNNGLKNSEKSKLEIYADKKLVDSFDFEPVEIGYGRTISVVNLKIFQMHVDELEFFINSSFNELNKENNKIILKIKSN